MDLRTDLVFKNNTVPSIKKGALLEGEKKKELFTLFLRKY